jgi:ribosome-binding protein aMBF1 (putative translation factor)
MTKKPSRKKSSGSSGKSSRSSSRNGKAGNAPRRTRKKTDSLRKKSPTSDLLKMAHSRYYDGRPDADSALARARLGADVASRLHALRKQEGVSQAELATLVGTTRSVIARLEDDDYQGHSLAMLHRIAMALGRRVQVRFVKPRETGGATAGR